jgi:four helix bundle protein
MISEEAEGENPRQRLRLRTKSFAIRLIKLYASLEKKDVAQVLDKQMLRSATSVGAHYREASRARSTAEFISKMEVGIQGLDETGYWLELLVDSKTMRLDLLKPFMEETEQLLAMFVASVRTAKRSN